MVYLFDAKIINSANALVFLRSLNSIGKSDFGFLDIASTLNRYFCKLNSNFMRIYLLGYMGSGKSSIGKKIATKLKYSYIDLDQSIEKEHNQSISALFADKGEHEFRRIERLALHKTFISDNLVVSTGGGTSVFFDNLELMLKNGLCIYLKADSGILTNRLIPNQKQRPLIAHLDKEDLQIFIEDQLKIRAPFYEKAQLHIESKDLTPEVLYSQIQNWVKYNLNPPKI